MMVGEVFGQLEARELVVGRDASNDARRLGGPTEWR